MTSSSFSYHSTFSYRLPGDMLSFSFIFFSLSFPVKQITIIIIICKAYIVRLIFSIFRKKMTFFSKVFLFCKRIYLSVYIYFLLLLLLPCKKKAENVVM